MNEYNWGDFKGDPLKLMEKYFDAFLYVANWETHWFMLRAPHRLINVDLAKKNIALEKMRLHIKKERT